MLDIAISEINKVVTYLFRVETHTFKCFGRFPDRLSKIDFDIGLLKKLSYQW